MPAAYDKLEKILRLEQSQGYHNRAVIGGLESFAENWRKESLGQSQDENLNQQVNEIADLLLQYAESDKARRAQTIDGILSRMSARVQ